MSRNMLSLLVGALIVAVGVLGYAVYEDRRQPEGLQIDVGKDGLAIKNK